MRFPWQPREYTRTCAECGYSWQVPRSAARRHFRSISMLSVASRAQHVDRGELNREMRSISAGNQRTEVYRHCPKCGADHFTQRS
jgi:DNA-directed RNA polymerase subunit M/transcription elongation factor TFIIS